MTNERATGIIRTLPSLYNGFENSKGERSIGFERYRRAIKELAAGQIPAIYIALQAIPKQEVLHMYLLIEGEIRVRLNIAEYVPGHTQICWDSTIRTPKFWAVCTAPVSKPPEPIKWKGFQGIRYTEELW